MKGIELIPVDGFPEVRPGDDLEGLIAGAIEDTLRSGDVLVVTHKIMSKAEGRLVDLRTVEPSALAKGYAARWGKDPRQIEVVFRESRRVVRMDRGVVISETHHGFVCANAGVDASNVAPGWVCLLPLDPDLSARRLKARLRHLTGADVAVVISDTFGRTWRQGQTNVAIGVAGIDPFLDYRGQRDSFGNELSATIICVADELAGAAELVMGKSTGRAAALIRGAGVSRGPGSAAGIVRPPEEDLFR